MSSTPDAVHDTVRAYDLDAVAYVEASPTMPSSVRADVESFAELLGPGARVLEIGSGGGRDARLMEELGLRVRRTDITPAFVALLREQGVDADLLDPLVDDLASPEGPYDAVWANASLLHVDRSDLATVLARVAAVTRPAGVLRVSVKEGEGEGWSTHGSVRHPRHFTYWRAEELREVTTASGWTDVDVRSGIAGRRSETWLELTAFRGSVGA
jgi:SAM-dependent methyltransferase